MSEQRATLSVDEASQVLGIDRKSLYEAIKRHEFPALRFGRRILVSRAVLDRVLDDGHLDQTPGGSNGHKET